MDYDTIIGLPFYRLREDGNILNRYGKVVHFNKRGECNMIVGGKVQRVRRCDILRCVAEGKDITTLYPKNKRLRQPSKSAILKRYSAIHSNIGIITNALITGNGGGVLLHLYKRIPQYIAHFRYLTEADPDELRDIVVDKIEELVADIMDGKRIVVAPDNYIIKMTRTALARRYKEIPRFTKKDFL